MSLMRVQYPQVAQQYLLRASLAERLFKKMSLKALLQKQVLLF